MLGTERGFRGVKVHLSRGLEGVVSLERGGGRVVDGTARLAWPSLVLGFSEDGRQLLAVLHAAVISGRKPLKPALTQPRPHRTAKAAEAATVHRPTTAHQPAWTKAKAPSAEPTAMPMNMAVSSMALSRLRAAGSRL